MAQYHLWRPIVSGLDVCVELLIGEAARPEIDYLDATFVGSLQQNVLGLDIAMDYVVFVEEQQRGEHLDRDPPDQLAGQRQEFVYFYQLVQVVRQNLERHAEVLAEYEGFLNLNDIHTVILVSLSDVFQYPVLDFSLTIWSLLVSDNFQSSLAFIFMIERSIHLTKRSSSQFLNNLIPIRDMVMGSTEIPSLLIVKAKIIVPFGLFWRIFTQEVNYFVLEYFCLLKHAYLRMVFANNVLGPTGDLHQIVTFGCCFQSAFLCVLVLGLLRSDFLEIPPNLAAGLLGSDHLAALGSPVLGHTVLIRREICLLDEDLLDGVVVGGRALPADDGAPVDADVVDVPLEGVPFTGLVGLVLEQEGIDVDSPVDVALLSAVVLK